MSAISTSPLASLRKTDLNSRGPRDCHVPCGDGGAAWIFGIASLEHWLRLGCGRCPPRRRTPIPPNRCTCSCRFRPAAGSTPGNPSYGHAGNGTSPHLAGELLKYMAKVDIAPVPYKGGAPSLNDLLGGHIPLSFNNIP